MAKQTAATGFIFWAHIRQEMNSLVFRNFPVTIHYLNGESKTYETLQDYCEDDNFKVMTASDIRYTTGE